MRRIVGSVLTAKSRAGVSNVVVVAYHLPDKCGSLRDPHPTDEHLEALGDRLGSAATDLRGEFVIPLDHLEVVIGSNASHNEESSDYESDRVRAVIPINLMVAVFASDTLWVRAGGGERALSRSSVRPSVTSEQEAFVLLVDDSIAPSSAASSVDLAEHIVGAYDQSDAIKAKLAARHKQVRTEALEGIKSAREKVAELSAVPRELRATSNYIAYGKKDLAAKLRELQEAVLQAGCEKFQTIATSANPRRRLMRLVLDKSQIHDLNLTLDGDKVQGSADAAKLSGMLHAAIGGASLTRVNRVDLTELSRLRARYLSDRPAKTDKETKAEKAAAKKIREAAEAAAEEAKALAAKKNAKNAANAGGQAGRKTSATKVKGPASARSAAARPAKATSRSPTKASATRK